MTTSFPLFIKPRLPPPSLRSYLDMAKVFLFSYFFWLVLCLIFITGTTRISIFCLGYLVACFYFMLFGSTLLMQPVRYILRLWDWLIGYTCLVIAMKNLLSVSHEAGKRSARRNDDSVAVLMLRWRCSFFLIVCVAVGLWIGLPINSQKGLTFLEWSFKNVSPPLI